MVMGVAGPRHWGRGVFGWATQLYVPMAPWTPPEEESLCTVWATYGARGGVDPGVMGPPVPRREGSWWSRANPTAHEAPHGGKGNHAIF